MKKNQKKILLPLGEREVTVTNWRLMQLAANLAAKGWQVYVSSYNREIIKKAAELLKDVDGVHMVEEKADKPLLTMQNRDSFGRTFIKLNHDVMLPGTDFHYWKLVGFDDFLWNVASNIFPKITYQYDLILLPIPSFHDQPSNICDVFYTNIIFYARENHIPVIGLQIHPVYSIPPNFRYLVDHVIVTDDAGEQYYQNRGMADRVFYVRDFRDAYALTSVQDPYKELLIEEPVRIGRDKLAVALMNTAKNRPQLYDIIHTLSALPCPVELFVVFSGYAVRNLTEQNIFDDLVRPLLNKTIKRFYTVEPGGGVKALMLCDIMIGTEYYLLLEFAQKYRKTGVVYNPLIDNVEEMSHVRHLVNQDDLAAMCRDVYHRKQDQMDVDQVVEAVLCP